MSMRTTRRSLLRTAALSLFSGLTLVPILNGTAFARSLQPLAALQFDPQKDIQPFTSTRQNDYPFVLVHGVAGFGRDALYGYKYWGGFTDIQQDLDNNGYTTYTAAIGPFSSNWDRVCELYAQIKGGTVDYGQAHAKKYGHDRYGRTYPGLYPQWGEVNPTTGNVNKIHLVSHSMGGQTIRMLAQLLENGSPDEQTNGRHGQLSPLFQGGKQGWIESIFTISAPHDGSTAANLIENNLPLAQQFIAFLAAVVGDTKLVQYDFGLDQWGLVRQPGESLDDYIKRVANSKIWQSTKDTAEWDLTPDGAAALNSWVNAQPDIYYFSVGTNQTFTDLITHHQDPEPYMNPLFIPFSTYMGSYTHNQPGSVVVDSSWWPNDGVVNTNSMPGPAINTNDQIIGYSGTPQIGQWNSLGVMATYGHIEIIGMGLRDVRSWYRGIAGFLSSLPA